MEQTKKIMLSVALAVYNEEHTIQRCLDSVIGLADEIVLVDGGSTDKTLSMLHAYPVSLIQSDNPPLFHINKQKALDACHGKWILQLDADEVVTDLLKKEIHSVLDSDVPINGYFIPRKNFFAGHWLRKGGQYPDYVMRLVRRGKAAFPCQSVHEQISVDGKTGYLREPLLHYSYDSIGDYWRKANAYIKLTATDMDKSHIPISIASWLLYMIWKPMQTFFLLYIRHKGFMDGFYGFLFAYYSGLHFLKAYKLYVQSRK